MKLIITILILIAVISACNKENDTKEINNFFKNGIPIKEGQIWVMKFDENLNPFESDSIFIKILRHRGNWSEFWTWDKNNKKLYPIDWNEWRSYDQKPDKEIKERFDFYSNF